MQTPVQEDSSATREEAREDPDLSVWSNPRQADRRTIEDGLAAVREWEAENGKLTDSERAAGAVVLDELDVPPRARSAA